MEENIFYFKVHLMIQKYNNDNNNKNILLLEVHIEFFLIFKILYPHAKSWLIGKDSDAGRDWGQEEKGTTEDEMAGWHHQLNGHECEWTLGVGDGQGGLASCDSWVCKELDTIEWLIWSDLVFALCAGQITSVVSNSSWSYGL